MFAVFIHSSDIDNNMPTRITPGFDLPDIEPQLQLGVPEFSNTAIYLDPVSTSSTVNITDSIGPSITYYSSARGVVAAPSSSTCLDTSIVESAIED